ncbi:MAG: MFS transporter [Steroidobacteraceae bacterium]|jgi:MFS family permease|nr:MFS transporter [Steroidobacteraceae bacterium]
MGTDAANHGSTFAGAANAVSERWRILAFSLLAWTLSNMDQSLFGYAVPGLLAEFRLGLDAVGLILSVSFVTAAVLAIAAGLAADRWGRRWTLAVLLGSSALLVGLHALATDPLTLTILRALAFGLAAGLAPITAAYVAEAAPDRYRGLLMGVLQCGYPLGWFLAALVATPLLESHGWRAIFLLGFAVVPIAILIGWRLPESGRFAQVAATSAPGTRRGGVDFALLRELFGPRYRRTSLAACGMFLAFGCAYAGSAFYFPTFFMEVRGYTAAEAAWLVGLSNGIAIAGYLLAAAVGEFVITRRNTFVLWCAIGAAMLLMLLWLPQARWHDLLLFALTTSFFYGSNAVVGTILTDLYPTRMRSTAFAACGSAPLSIGFATFPVLVPVGVAALGWQAALSVLVVPALVAAAACAALLPNRASGQPLDD